MFFVWTAVHVIDKPWHVVCTEKNHSNFPMNTDQSLIGQFLNQIVILKRQENLVGIFFELKHFPSRLHVFRT